MCEAMGLERGNIRVWLLGRSPWKSVGYTSIDGGFCGAEAKGGSASPSGPGKSSHPRVFLEV